jgi:hypothetical protein
MTRPAPKIIPLPAAQMALQRARRTIRDEAADDLDLLEACATLQREGDWMDHQTAEALRLAIFDRNGWRHPPTRATRRRRRALRTAAGILAAAIAIAILADVPHPTLTATATQETAP